VCSGRGFLKEAYHAIFQNDFQKAIEAFKKAINCEPTNASYYYKLSITYSRNGNMNQAIEAAQKACEYQPQQQTYRYHLQILQSKNLMLVANDLIQKNPYNSEIEGLLLQSKKLDPLNIQSYLLLGIYYGENNLLDQAIKEFNLIFNIEPFHKQAKYLRDYYIELYKEGD